MNLTDQLSAISLLIVYLAGLSVGLLGCTVYASVLENADMSLLGTAQDPITAGVRVLLGLFIRDDGYLRSLPPEGQPAQRPHGQEVDW
jgi:hypothetical protein